MANPNFATTPGAGNKNRLTGHIAAAIALGAASLAIEVGPNLGPNAHTPEHHPVLPEAPMVDAAVVPPITD